MVVKPTEGAKGLAIPQRYWDTYCSAAPPRPTWPEHYEKLEKKRVEANATRGVPRRRKARHLAAAAASAAAATAAGAGAGAPSSTHGARLRRRPSEDVNAVYGHASPPRSFEAAVEELVSGVARPSAMELAYAAAKQALFELAGRRTASWRAAVAPLTSQAPNGQDRLLARPETAPPTGAGRGPRRRQPED